MFKRKQKTPKAQSQSQVNNSEKESKAPFLKRLVSYFKTHKRLGCLSLV